MVKFSYANSVDGIKRYELTENETVLAAVSVKDNTVLKIEYADETADKRYGNFTLRSIAYVLRNNFTEVRFAFTDERLLPLGFTEEGGEMQAPVYKIKFDNCCCGGNE